MNRNEILSMPVGRDLDALVAEKVMGRNLWYGDPTGYKIVENFDYWRTDIRDSDDEYCYRCPRYSADIASAWEVMEEMKDKFQPDLIFENGEWECLLMAEYARARATTAPLAICRASLIAVLEAK